MKLRSPIHKKYHSYRKYCLVNQLFGENKNRLFYGPKGHQGIDFKTRFIKQYVYNNIKKWKAKITSKKVEDLGKVPIGAAHDGYLSMGYNDDQREGVYMLVTGPLEKENGISTQYQTLYFHLSELRVWKDDDKTTSFELTRGKDFIKAGATIGWGGNSGRYTTGPHLHFELRKRTKNGRSWGEWEKIDPMPYFKDNTVYQKGVFRPRYFYKGKEISKAEAKSIV